MTDYKALYEAEKKKNEKLKIDLTKAWDARGDLFRKARIKTLTEEVEKMKDLCSLCMRSAVIANEDLKSSRNAFKELLHEPNLKSVLRELLDQKELPRALKELLHNPNLKLILRELLDQKI